MTDQVTLTIQDIKNIILLIDLVCKQGNILRGQDLLPIGQVHAKLTNMIKVFEESTQKPDEEKNA